MSAALSQTTGSRAGFDAATVDDAMGFTSRPMGENLASGVPAAAGRPFSGNDNLAADAWTVNAWGRWTSTMIRQLRRLCADGLPWTQIADLMGRSVPVCRDHARKHGIVKVNCPRGNKLGVKLDAKSRAEREKARAERSAARKRAVRAAAAARKIIARASMTPSQIAAVDGKAARRALENKPPVPKARFKMNCLSCGKEFLSWDRAKNRRCAMDCDGGAW